jgi:hypothetical protein
MDRDHALTDRVSGADAQRLLERAAELDAADVHDLSRLRQSALEAGIRPEAFDSALAELRAPSAVSVASPTVTAADVPWWVRTGMWGVPDRAAAMVFYWAFAAGLAAIPVYLFWARVHGRAATNVIPLTLWLLFCVWSTSRTVRWMDERGIRTLPPRRARGAPGA